MVTIEETLLTTDMYTAFDSVYPFMIYSEILEGARRPLCFLEALAENFDLIGTTGNIIRFLRVDTNLTGVSSSYDTETEMENAGMSAAYLVFGAKVTLTCSTIYAGLTTIGDYLKEDYPKIDWIRFCIRNIGKTIMEEIEEDAYDVLAAASGVNTVSAASIAYSVVLDGIAELEKDSWFVDPANPPFLIIAPWAHKTLQAESTYVSTERYTTADLAKMVNGEVGLYAGCRVMVSPLLEGKETAFIIYPSNTDLGVVGLVAWKRRLTAKTDYELTYQRTRISVSARANAAVVQPKGIVKITISPTP